MKHSFSTRLYKQQQNQRYLLYKLTFNFEDESTNTKSIHILVFEKKILKKDSKN